MVDLEALQGEWRRSLLLWPDGRRDDTACVTWLQGPSLYADFRQPADLPDLADVRSLRELDRDQAEALARQEGFAGVLIRHADCFEWTRLVDFQPTTRVPDRGTLVCRGDLMVEEGCDLRYIEHWRRHGPKTGAALCLFDPRTGCRGILVRAADRFLYVRNRTEPLPGDGHLVEHVRRATSVRAAQDCVDCELSLGSIEAGWRIERSSLPWRVGARLAPFCHGSRLITSDSDPEGAPCSRIWTICVDEAGFLASIARRRVLEPCGDPDG